MHHSRAAASGGKGTEQPEAEQPEPSSPSPSSPALPGRSDRPAAQPAWSGLNRWWSLAASVAAGLALAGAFAPFGFWPLAIAGPAVLILAVWGKRRLMTFALALTCGLVFFVALLSWLVNVAWYAWLALALLEALIFAVLALALRPLLRLRFWPLAVAGWWVAQEAVHDRFPWGGFPWGRLAMSQPGAPTAGLGGDRRPPFADVPAGACGRGPGLPDRRGGGETRLASERTRRGRRRAERAGWCWQATWPGPRLLGQPRPRRSLPCRATSRTPGTCPTCSAPPR